VTGAAQLAGVEHHLDHALDMPIHRRQGADVHTQTARDARTHGLDVEPFALNFAGLDHVRGQGREARLVALWPADVSQAPHQQTLGTADLGHGSGQRRQVVAPLGPVVSLPDVLVIAAVHAEIIGRILRIASYSPRNMR